MLATPNTGTSLNRQSLLDHRDEFEIVPSTITAAKAKERMHLFVSIITNMAAISPSLTWALFLPYMFPYFNAKGSDFDSQWANTLFVLQIATAIVVDPLIAIAVRKTNAKAVVVLGYLFLLCSSVSMLFISDYRFFILVQGIIGSLGTSIVFVSSLIIV